MCEMKSEAVGHLCNTVQCEMGKNNIKLLHTSIQEELLVYWEHVLRRGCHYNCEILFVSYLLFGYIWAQHSFDG